MKYSVLICVWLAALVHANAQLEVTSSGNVGIGTSTPTDWGTGPSLEVDAPGGGVVAFKRAGASVGYIFAETGKLTISGRFSNELAFATNGTERLRVASDGNVGIGVSNPQEKLEVSGNIFLNPADRHLKIYANTEGIDSIVFCRSDDSHQASIATTAFGKSILLKSGGSEIVRFRNDGNVGIGTTNPNYKLEVAGTVRATSFISNTATYADFVFRPGYRLATLSEVETHIEQHGHLPGIPNEAEARERGIDLADMQVRLLQKIEELTLHAITQQKEIAALRAELRASKTP